MKLLGKYQNGNYNVFLYEDGTKIRYNEADWFAAAFPESIDVKISNRCNMGCLFCHECSTPEGKLANLRHPLFDSLHPYTELALGGGNVFEHPDLIDFLKRMAAKHIICNLTVHWRHFYQYYDTIAALIRDKLVWGIGVSVNEVVDYEVLELIEQMQSHVVIHSIAGVVPQNVLYTMSHFANKLLLLGYKEFGRGATYLTDNPDILYNIHRLRELLPELKKEYRVIAFDNLAIHQLQPQNLLTGTEWEHLYMGKDGEFTMYLDMVEEQYAISSTSPRHPITSNKIEELFLC